MTQRILGHGLRAWLSAHSKLSVGCGHGNLRRELDGLTVRTTLVDQMIKTTYSANHCGVPERRVQWILLRAREW